MKKVFSLLFWFLATVTCGMAQDGGTAKATPEPTPAPVFYEIAEQTGLDFIHFNGMTGKLYLPEIMGSGSAFLDYDNDGDLDVFLVQQRLLEPGADASSAVFPWKGKEPPKARLFRNDLSGGTIAFTDVTEKSRIVAEGYGFGVATGDINNDGNIDLYVCNLGSNKLFLNKGDGTFEDITLKSGADDPRWSIGASFFDYDRDGLLDLMVINYAGFDISAKKRCYSPSSARDYCGPSSYLAVGNSLFRNKGNATFENVTVATGIASDFGHALGVISDDFNDDGWPDIYVANDGDPNQLWINQKNGKFENEAYFAGAAVNGMGQSEASMGVDSGDFNQDGTEDLFVTHLMEETHTLYANLGKAVFEDITRKSAMNRPDQRLTGFGTAFFDYDNDGLLDLFVANGAVKLLRQIVRPGNTAVLDEKYPLGQQNQLFKNVGSGKFDDVSAIAGEAFQLFEVSRGASFGDIDNDGDTDVLVVNNSGKARLMLNNTGNKNRWIGLRLVGKDTARDVIGTRVEVTVDKNKPLRRRVRTDGSYSSAQDPRVLVGLGAAGNVLKIRVFWLGGAVEEFDGIPQGAYSTIREGGGKRIEVNEK